MAEKQLACHFCKDKVEIDKVYDKEYWTCKYCKHIFCSKHLDIENHNCIKSPKEGHVKEARTVPRVKGKRPIWIYLIIIWLAWVFLNLLYINSMTTTSGSFSGIFLFFYILMFGYGVSTLWNMQKNHLWDVYLLLGFGLIMEVIALWFGKWLIILDIAISSFAIYWLYKHRDLFVEVKPKPKTAEDKRKEKNEWKKLGLIVLGLFGIPFLSVMINIDIFYGILVVPIWMIFVWFILPKYVKWLR